MRRHLPTILCALVAALPIGCAAGPGLDPGRGVPPGTPGSPSSPTTEDGGGATPYDGASADDGGSATPTPTPTPMPPAGPAPTPGVDVPPLPCGRTYDQQTAYFVRSPGATNVTLQHKDDTTLPASEGSVACGVTGGCSESVTRLADGEWIEGVLFGIDTFTLQPAFSSASGVGWIRLEACGSVVLDWDMTGSGRLPGFVNTSPAFHLPAGETCVFRATAHGGYVDVRAVTTSGCSAPTPTPNQP